MQTRIAVRILAGCLAAGCLLGAGLVASAQVVPHWNVGDTWQVGVWQGQAYLRPGSRVAASQGAYNPRGRLITVSFQVSGVQAIDDQECYEVQVTFPREETGFQRSYKAYYVKDTGALVRIRDVSVSPGGTARDTTREYPAKPHGPVFADDVASLVPLDWPDWSQETVTPPADGVRRMGQTTSHDTVQGADGASQQVDQITLTRVFGQKETKVVQRWSDGQPWWIEAKKYDNGRLVAEAMLLEVNGKKIADAPKAPPADAAAGATGSP